MTGKVWLVGAGPGDRGLLTLKGLEGLKAADVGVFAALVGQEVLTLIPQSAELVNVGKRAGNHIMPQERINRLLLEKAQEGKKVVRLKGGDPFLFGRGGEELELLSENGIPYEVVPGITSALAVPAYNGIPVTHRDCASSVHIITGHRRKGKDYDIDFEALVRTGGTLVFLMGVSSLESIMKGLLEAGMDPGTPAAVLQSGTTAGQRRVVSTVSGVKKDADRAGIEAPAVIVVGEVCALAKTLAWYEKLPLAGRRILVTRPREHISELSARLRSLGAEVMELPAIATEKISPNPELEKYLREAFGGAKSERFAMAGSAGFSQGGRAGLSQGDSAGFSQGDSAGFSQGDSAGFSHADEEEIPGPCDWIVFTSPTGVKIFMDLFLAEYDPRDLWRTRLAVIGKGSAGELEKYGLKPDFMPSVYDGETLGRELRERILEERGKDRSDGKPGKMSVEMHDKRSGQESGRTDEHIFVEGSVEMSGVATGSGPDRVRILIPRARIGNRELISELKGRSGESGTDGSGKNISIDIADIPTYDTVYASGGAVDAASYVRSGKIDYVVFTSSSTVRGFSEAMKGVDLSGFLAVCIGKQTKAEADRRGMKTRMSESATIESLVLEVLAAAGRR